MSKLKKVKRGAPKKPKKYLKKTRTIRIADHVWKELKTLGGGYAVQGIEHLVENFTSCIVNPLEND